ncbi:MAG: YegP family protein [Methylophilaceae bacterium]|nr:YegP family protein [Methylophilaceae bacterium]
MDQRYDQLTSKSDKPHLIIRAGNHQVIGQSQVYELVAARDNHIESVRKIHQKQKLMI